LIFKPGMARGGKKTTQHLCVTLAMPTQKGKRVTVFGPGEPVDVLERGYGRGGLPRLLVSWPADMEFLRESC